MEGASTFYSAEFLSGRSERTPCILEDVKFLPVKEKCNTKIDALKKEISELYKSRNLDELIRNSDECSRHMMEVGLFASCQPRITTSKKVGSGKNSYTVEFVVKEPSLLFEAKADVSTTASIQAKFGVQKGSIFGRGEVASLAYLKSVNGDDYDFTASKPFLGWRKYSDVNARIFRNSELRPWNKANLIENALMLGHNRQLLQNRLSQSLRFYLGWRFFEPRDDAPFPVREHAGHTTKISLENIIKADSRDRPVLPTRGGLLQLSTEYAGLLGDSSFVKNQLDIQGAAPLFWKSFLVASLRLAAMQSVGDRSIHLLDRIYMGGPQDVRGFEYSSLGTRAETSCLGGAAGYGAGLHIYRPLIPADMLFAHAFITAGSVASVRSRNWIRDMSENPRVSAGLGLTFILMKHLRVELNYVHPLRYVPGDAFASTRIQFGMGFNFM
ncbi:surface antigen domain-containing protein [Ditylenchus destructor]|uniref:Surface antigen domain-containing protein n=1 Tax=Ditylenchus destructor TaxID=166010 RepID=A0AAD4NKR2_9BILA|nr:surface antigen domain-containing protein [Ditylenchus destructor]